MLSNFSEAVKLAIEKGGYRNGIRFFPEENEREEDAIFDPQFWLSLGKALNWADNKFYQADAAHPHIGEEMPEAKWYFRSFMELKWNGGNEEQFFNELLKGKV